MAVGLPSGAGDSFAPGTTLGRYELIATIGEGGMARVILARQRGPAGFEKAVVIKVILPHRARDQHAIAMLLDEARVAARIDHPNVVHTYELGEAHGTYYIVMEYLAGESFTQLLRRAFDHRGARLTPQLAARVVAEAAAGLHAAHELTDPHGEPLGIVHRDVSPSNLVVLYNGAVKVVDFGIAKAHGRVSSTQDGELKGKYGYMSPEQIENAPMDRRSDVFSLGVVLWESLALRRLFRADNVAATLMQILAARRVPPSQHMPDVPPALDAIALKALARDPRDRFASAAEMKAAIEDAIWQSRCGTPEVATHMSTLFADRIAQRRSLLARAAAHESIVAVLATLDATSFMEEASPQLVTAPQQQLVIASQDPTQSFSAPLPVPVPTPVPASVPTPVPVPVVGPLPAPRRWRLGAIIAIAVLAVGGTIAAVIGYAADGPVAVAPSAPSTAIATGSVPASQAPIVEPIPTVAPDPVPSPAALAPAPAPTPTPTVDMPAVIDSSPPAEDDKPTRRHRATATAAPAPPATTKPEPPAPSPVPAAAPAAAPASEAKESADALYREATAHYLAARFPAAERSFKQALAVDKRYAPAYRGLGVLYQRTGKTDAAIEAFTRYLELAPGAGDAAGIRKRLDQLGGAP